MSVEATTKRVGLVSVVDGRLVLDADPDGAPAVVVAGQGVTLRRGGTGIDTRLELHSLGGVEVDPGSSEPASRLEVEIAADGLSAQLTVSLTQGLRYVLEDQAPAHELTLTRALVERIPARVPSEAEAMSALDEAGVVVGILPGEIAAALHAADGSGRVVARGRPPQPPVDAEVDLMFTEQREASQLFTVPRGTLLATKTPGRPGVDGMSVRGAPIAAAKPKDAPLAAGAGTVRSMGEDGTVSLRAGVDGRPGLAGAMVIVEERITLAGDVDVSVGDVSVLASLVVTGSVEEGRSVRAKHDLEIVGGVERAELEAGGSLSVTGSCMHSRLRAGGRQAVIIKLLTALGDAPEQLEVMAAIVDRLVTGAAERGQDLRPGAALLVLVEGKFAHVRARLRDAVAVVRGNESQTFEDAVASALESVHHVTDGLGMHELESGDALRRLVAELSTQIAAMRRQVEEPAAVRVAYLQACEVEASGSLVITGQGVFNSELFVGGDLSCEAPTSTLRGGSARVGGIVRVHELGGSGGARLTVSLEGPTAVPDRLHADLVHSGVHVLIGGVEFAFEEPAGEVLLGADADGVITRRR